MAKYVVYSRLSFARNSVVTENLRLRNLPLLQADNRYLKLLTTINTNSLNFNELQATTAWMRFS
jgi:hypothetical protein